MLSRLKCFIGYHRWVLDVRVPKTCVMPRSLHEVCDYCGKRRQRIGNLTWHI